MATGRIGTTPVLTTRWSKAPAAGTTSLSGLDDNSVSLVYSVGYEAVYQNGVLLSRGNDYTATNGTTITLTTATVAGDIIEVFANQTIPLTDTYSQTVSDGRFIKNTLITTTGDIIYASAANTPARLAIGSTSQVLTVSGGVPSWATPSSGGMTQLASGSLSGSAVNLTSISSSYIDLYLVIRDMNITSAGQVINMRFNNNSSGIYQISNSSVSGYQVNATDTSMLVGIGNLSTSGDNSYAITINDYNNSSFKIGTAISATVENAGGYGLGDQRFMMRSTTAISEINLFMTTGNFSGSYILYGVK